MKRVMRARGFFASGYATGGRIDSRIRGLLHRGRATWLLWAVFYYSLFELLAPFAVRAPTRYLRVVEGIAFSAVATALTWLILRRRVE